MQGGSRTSESQMGRALGTQQTGGFNHDNEKMEILHSLCEEGSTDPCQLLSYPRLSFNELRDFPHSCLTKHASNCWHLTSSW